ncbi:GntR family transcriptional regulator [Trinickia dinghuensis]|uniref:GntR family transcriptional regulator n=1 Tax=Trinickia dinghuensis TaxID=2291023 RepID=A0A3D8JNK7_9BURK|nr:GntR family transcriptional regulator [Trinickia dinghuensis]RDU94689.1 GntR family transcriptional regulator [Trinickia dinghuensis]
MDRRLRALKVDENDPTPMYLQLARRLTAAIEAGEWLAGEALPPERTLVDTLGISRVTTRRALKMLEDDGVIVRNRGAGTFIAPRFEQVLSRLDSFSEMVRPRGFVPHSELIEFRRRKPTHEEMSALALQPKDDVVSLTRLKRADATAISIHSSTLPHGIVPSIERVGESLYEYLDEIGKPIVRAMQHFRGAVADDEQADLLGLQKGAPLLLVIRVGYTHDDVPIEFTKTYCVNEYYDFVVELKR